MTPLATVGAGAESEAWHCRSIQDGRPEWIPMAGGSVARGAGTLWIEARKLATTTDSGLESDPCLEVDPATAAGQVVHEGTTYYCCSRGCQQAFEANPTRYLAKGD